MVNLGCLVLKFENYRVRAQQHRRPASQLSSRSLFLSDF